MKHVLIFSGLFTMCVLSSCVESPKYKNPQPTILKQDDDVNYPTEQEYRIATLDGCEYIIVGDGSGKWGSHKGNCKNQIHAWNKK